MALPAWFLLMLPQLVGGVSKLVASKSALNKMNLYNSPVKQMQRVREAGLPFAAFAAGQTGQQSQLPDLSGFDTIGNAVGTAVNQGNQIKMFHELLRKAGFDADIAGNLRDISNEETKTLLNNFVDIGGGNKTTIAGAKKMLEFNINKFGAWSAEHQEKIAEINRKIMEARFESGKLMEQADEEFERLVNTNKSMRQAWETVDKQNEAFQEIIDTMRGSDGKLGFMESLLIEFLKAIGGGFKTDSKGGGFQLNY